MHEMLRTPVLWEPLEGNMPQSTALAGKLASLKLPESARLQGSGGFHKTSVGTGASHPHTRLKKKCKREREKP